MSADRSDVGQSVSDPLDVSDLGLDDILDAAGLDDPARRRHATRDRIGAALARAQQQEPDAFGDLGNLELDDSAPEDVFEQRPFRYSAPPVPGLGDEGRPVAGAPDPTVDPHGDTFAGPGPEGLVVDAVDVGPTLVLDRDDLPTSGAHQVADLLERGMRRRGYTPAALERIDTGNAPTIDPESGEPLPAELARAAARGDARAAEDSAIEGVPLDEDSAIDGVPLDEDSAIEGVPLDDAAPDADRRNGAHGRALLALDVSDFYSAPPALGGRREAAAGSPDVDAAPSARARETEPVEVEASEAAQKRPRSVTETALATYVLEDLPPTARARIRREQAPQTPRSERRRVMHGEDARVLGRASVSARAFAGVREERNSARERSDGVESLLRDYVNEQAVEVPSDGDAPAAGILRRRGARKKNR